MLLECVRFSVAELCGDAGGQWLYVFKSHMMLPVQQRVGCSSKITGVRSSSSLLGMFYTQLHKLTLGY